LENRTGCASIAIDFLVASAHKFHGPKVGFAFIRKNSGLQPLFFMNRKTGLRAGTEAIHQIVEWQKHSSTSKFRKS
jgi:cysteine desulfurase